MELARNLQAEEEDGEVRTASTDPSPTAGDAEGQNGGKGETDTAAKTIVPSNQLRLSAIIGQYLGLSKTDGRYRVCTHRDMVTVANWLHTIPLSIPDK
jgi:hypothetical protein